MSTLIISILLAAVGSAMRIMLLTTSVSSPTSPVTQTITARASADRIMDDLKIALSVPEVTTTAITLTVPDRDGDLVPETIRYAWSGTNGAPLTRAYNGGTATPIVDNVNTFSFEALYKTVGPVILPPVESSEQVLSSYSSTATAAYSVLATAWPAEWFAPSFPANTLHWKITRVKVRLMRAGTKAGIFTVGIYAVDNGKKPTGTALASGTVDISTVSSSAGGQWVDVVFSSPLAGIAPSSKLAIVVSTTVSPSAGSTIHDNGPPAMTNMGYTTSSDGGASWASPVTSKAMQYFIYGTYTTQP